MLQQTSLVSSDPAVDDVGVIPVSYFESKRIAAFRVLGDPRILDLRSVETHAALRKPLAQQFLTAGYSGDFNFGEIIGTDYRVTQNIARWAFDQGYGGIAYPSSHNHTLTCWALFDTVQVEPTAATENIRHDDPSLVAATNLFGLLLPDWRGKK